MYLSMFLGSYRIENKSIRAKWKSEYDSRKEVSTKLWEAGNKERIISDLTDQIKGDSDYQGWALQCSEVGHFFWGHLEKLRHWSQQVHPKSEEETETGKAFRNSLETPHKRSASLTLCETLFRPDGVLTLLEQFTIRATECLRNAPNCFWFQFILLLKSLYFSSSGRIY